MLKELLSGVTLLSQAAERHPGWNLHSATKLFPVSLIDGRRQFLRRTKPAWLLSYERTNQNVHVVASKFYRETDRNEKYWIKNTRERSNLCLSRIFILSQS